METVTMDFAFPHIGKIYGTFLVTVYEHYEDVKMVDAANFYKREMDTVFVSVEVPHDIAIC